MAGGSRGALTIVVAMLSGLAVAGAKLLGFLATLSATLLASSAHSFVDAGNEALLLVGRRRARRPATLPNPFGYGRERYFWSFTATVILFCLGGALAVVEGLRRVGGDGPDGLDSPVLIGMAAGGAVVEAVALAVAVRQARAAKGAETTWPRFLRRTTRPEFPVVLVQKTGALLGLVLAAGALTATHVTGDPAWDAYGMVAIGGLMVLLAAALAVEMKCLLITRTACTTDQQRIAAAIEIEPSVTRLLHMRTEHLGPDEMLVGAKIELVDGMTVEDVSEVVGRIEVSVRRAVPAAQLLYLEPDICRTGEPADARQPVAGRHFRTRGDGSNGGEGPSTALVTVPATDAAEFTDLADLDQQQPPDGSTEQALDDAGWGTARPLDPAPLPVPPPSTPARSERRRPVSVRPSPADDADGRRDGG